MGIRILAQIPDFNTPSLITTDDFALIGMDDDVVDGTAVTVISLHVWGTEVPDFDGAVFGGGGHPFCFNVEGDA
jgi:hypothetical protein